ncbi:hypothetical protein DENSPDRAFT_932403 [Dentipellis sp. KUC8613]|nr:hypothetical protein DENSPDRAFT_932403 [Dentipellis sp. KUC8613]
MAPRTRKKGATISPQPPPVPNSEPLTRGQKAALTRAKNKAAKAAAVAAAALSGCIPNHNEGDTDSSIKQGKRKRTAAAGEHPVVGGAEGTDVDSAVAEPARKKANMATARTPKVPRLDINDNVAPASIAHVSPSASSALVKGKQPVTTSSGDSDDDHDVLDDTNVQVEDEIELDEDDEARLQPSKFAQAVANERPQWVDAYTFSSSNAETSAAGGSAPNNVLSTPAAPVVLAPLDAPMTPAVPSIPNISIAPPVPTILTVPSTPAAPIVPNALSLSLISHTPVAPATLDAPDALVMADAVDIPTVPTINALDPPTVLNTPAGSNMPLAAPVSLAPSIASVSSAATMPVDPAIRWPEWTNVIAPAHGHRIRLADQHAVVRQVLQDAIPHIKSEILFGEAFPDAILLNLYAQRSLLLAASSRPLAAPVHDRMLHDNQYLRDLQPIPKARVGIFRADIKKTSDTFVPTMYHLGAPGLVMAQAANNALADYNYIFPRTGQDGLTGNINRTKPYSHMIGVALMRVCMADDFFERNRASFPFFIDPATNERQDQLPKAVVALAFTAVYASLHDHRLGFHRRSDFTANLYLDVYRGHIATLDHLEATRSPFYRNMMRDLYESVKNANAHHAPAVAPALAIAVIDFGTA